jgi:hypothetical protein
MKNGLLIALCLCVVGLVAPSVAEARCCRPLFPRLHCAVQNSCNFVHRSVAVVKDGCCRTVERTRTVIRGNCHQGQCTGDKCTVPAEVEKAPKKADAASLDNSVVEAPSEGDLWAVEVALLERTNEMRVRHGLRPLQLCRNLLSTAREHSWWMARNRNMSHGNTYMRYGSSENIAMNNGDAATAVQQWMNSSRHKAAMLSASYTRLGVAAYTAPNGATYYTQQFGR